METKDFVLLMLIPIILMSIVVYTDKNPVITGAVTAKQEESNLIGTYSIMPSFKAKIDYDLNDYNKIKESFDTISNCAQSKDVESCINDINNNQFAWSLNCDKGAEKVLYDFAEFLQDCFDSEDNNCVCVKNLGNEKIQEYALTGKYEIEIKDISSNELELNMLKVNDESSNLELFHKINTKGISGWIPRQYIIAYTNDKLFGLNLIFKEISGEIRGLGPLNEIIIYKNNNNPDKIKSIDFVRQEGSNLIYPTPGKIVQKPADLHPCQLKPKNIYKFCVTQNKYKVTAYDKLDGQVKERNPIIKFASYIPTPPPKIQGFEIYDRPKAEKSMIVKWRMSLSDIEKYKIYFTETPNILDKNPTSDLNKDPRVIIKEIKPNEAILTNVGTSIKLDNCDFEYSIRKCQFSDSEGYKISIEKDKLYYNKDNGLYIYHLSVPKEAQDHDFAITTIDKNGKELSNIGENQKIAVISSRKSIDDLPPDKIQTLEGIGTPDGKVKLKWKMPVINTDGSSSSDLIQFNIYQKKFIPTSIPESLDNSYDKKTKHVSEICDIKLNCEYTVENLETGQFYNFAVTAIDQNLNEFTEELNIIKVPVPIS